MQRLLDRIRRKGKKGGPSNKNAASQASSRSTTPTLATNPAPLAAVDNTSQVAVQSVRQPPDQDQNTDLQDDPSMAQKALDWWKANKGTILASTQFVFETVEKGLDGMPIPGPKAAFGAVARAIEAVQTMDNNNTMIEEIVDQVEKMTDELVDYTAPLASNLLSSPVSAELSKRLRSFVTRLAEAKMSASKQSTMRRTLVMRLADAKRISEELKGVWEQMKMAYIDLIAATTLNTERKIDQLQEQFLLGHLKPALSALHDAAGAAPSCLEGTRKQLLTDIAKWIADSSHSAKPVYWLKGVAGTGKTTVAQSVAKMARQTGFLAATFFFSRTSQDAERRRVAAVIPTIAHQLARKHVKFRSRLRVAIESEPDVREKGLENQVKTLLSADVLGHVTHTLPFPLVIVLDALDECEEERRDEANGLINVLLTSLQGLPFVKIFITSRPEQGIETAFDHPDMSKSWTRFALHLDIEKAIVQSDISHYLKNELGNLSQRRSGIPTPFPSDKELGELANRAGTLFIYARTVVAFIAHKMANPMVQLGKILDHHGSSQYTLLDSLYLQVLEDAQKSCRGAGVAQQDFSTVLASLVLAQESVPTRALTVLTSIEEEDCKTIIRSLSSVLLYDEQFVAPVHLVHQSFADFLVDDKRCVSAKYTFDVSVHHLGLAERCLQTLNNNLRENICGLDDPSLLNSEVVKLDERLNNVAPLQLRYSCRFWHVHLSKAMNASNKLTKLPSSLEQFSSKHLLHWLELASLLDEYSTVQRGLPVLLASFKELSDDRTKALLCDTNGLVFVYSAPIRVRALHVYHAARATMPACELSEHYTNIDRTPVMISKPADGWNTGVKIFEGHSDDVSCVTFSQDGQSIVSGSVDKTVRVWNAATGAEQLKLTGHEMSVTSVAFSPDGQSIVSGSADNTVRLWNTATGAEQRKLTGHKFYVTSVAFSPDGQSIVSGSKDRTVRVWNAATGAEQLKLTGHEDSVTSVVFSPDRQSIVSGSADKTVRVWNAATGAEQLKLTGHDRSVTSVVFSPDGQSIVSGSVDITVRVWNAATGAEQLKLTGHENMVWSVAFSPDGQSIVSSSADNTVRLWNAATGAEQLELTGHDRSVTSVVFSPDGQSIVSGSEDRTVRVWNAATGAEQRKLTGHDSWVTSVVFSPDGQSIVSGSVDMTVRVWNAATGAEQLKLTGHEDMVWSVVFSPDGQSIVSSSFDMTVRVWNATTGAEQRKLTGHENMVWSVAFSPDGQSIVSGSADKTVRVWNAKTGAEQLKLTGHEMSITSVAFSPDGQSIVSALADNTVRVWNAKTGAEQHKLTGHEDSVEFVAFSRDIDMAGITPDEPLDYRLDDSGWITCSHACDASNAWRAVCWLPIERRKDAKVAYSKHRVCIGAGNGAITILDFSNVRLPPLAMLDEAPTPT